MKAEKLPSGNWRVQLYIGTDPSGRKRKKSFTARTKREAEMLAAKYNPSALQTPAIPISELCARYIEMKEPVLSPATIRTYRTILRSAIQPEAIGRKQVSRLTPADVQTWVSSMSRTSCPKTVKNALSFLSAACSLLAPDVQIRARVPQQMRRKNYAPTDADIAQLLNASDGEMQKAILLGAFCGLRRGEIIALDAQDDIDRISSRISVTKAVVRGEHGYTVKPPKTEDSNRDVPVPDWVLERLPETGPVVNMTLAALTTAFGRIITKAGLPHFRFHDLRHFYATRLSYLGVPRKLICDMGGWRTDRVFKAHYEDTVSDELEREKNRVMRYFSRFDPKSSHEVPTDHFSDAKNA